MIDRKDRQKDTQEFFTPEHIIQQMLMEAPNFLLPFLESSVGNGAIALAVYDKIKNDKKLNLNHKEILNFMWLADLQEDNCIETIQKLEAKNNNFNLKIDVIRKNEIPKNLQTEGLEAIFKVNNEPYWTVVQADTTLFNWWRPKNSFFDKWFQDEPHGKKSEYILRILHDRLKNQ